MKNWVQEGRDIVMTAPYTVVSGAGVLLGAVFGVANADAASGAAVTATRIGVFTLAKATGQAWTALTTKLYWDDTNKVVTSSSSGNTLIGVARNAAASGDTTGNVLLTGQIA